VNDRGSDAPGRGLLLAWRHPRAVGATGRCIGRTDLPVDARKARRLAHRIRAEWRRRTRRGERIGREVWVSPLARSQAVGRWLARWGWTCRVDARLAELDFGAWDGRRWADIPWAEVEAWQADLWQARPAGNGEALAALAQRVRSFIDDAAGAGATRCIVTHGGWLNVALHVPRHTRKLAAADWPTAPRHGSLSRIVTERA
jgi:alpha-ribazole phosphatase